MVPECLVVVGRPSGQVAGAARSRTKARLPIQLGQGSISLKLPGVLRAMARILGRIFQIFRFKARPIELGKISDALDRM